MIKKICLMLALLGAPSLAHTAPAIERIGLSQGEAWLWPESEPGLVALTILFDGGARLDPADRQGIGSMVAGLLEAGAGPLDAGAFQTRLADHAIKLDFDLGRDYLAVDMQFLPEVANEAFLLLRLALSAPHFAPNEQQRVRQQLLSALAAQAQNPNAIAWQGWKELAFGNHPYAANAYGTPASLAAIERDDIRQHYQRLLGGARFIGASGAIAPDKLQKHLNKLFAAMPRRKSAPALPALRLPSSGKQHYQQRQQGQSLLYFGLPALKRDDEDFIPAFVMTHILGGSSVSALSRAARDEEGLVYHISLSLVPWKLGGILVGQAATEPERAAQLLEVIKRELREMAQTGVSEKALAQAKAYLTGAYVLRFDRSSDIASQLAALAYYGLGADYITERNAQINAVSVEQIQAVAQKLLIDDNLLLFTLGPEKQ